MAVTGGVGIATDGAGRRQTAPFLQLVRTDWLLIGALTLLAAAIRFHDLGSESLTNDEATTFQRASLPLADLVRNSIEAGHTPTYFLLMHPWLGLGGGEFMLRAPSAVFGALAVPVCYALGKLIAGRRAAAVAALLMTASVFQVYYAQTARSYSLLTLCVAIAMLGLVWLVRHPDRAVLHPRQWRRCDRAAGFAWIGYALGTLAALAIHNMAVFFLLAANAVLGLLALRLRSGTDSLIPNWLRANAVILCVWIWWWPVLFRQGSEIIDRFWIPAATLERILAILSEVYLDAPYGELSISLPFLALLGAWTLRRTPWLMTTLLALLLAAPVAILSFEVIQPLFVAKQLVWTVIPFFLLAACGVASLRPKPLFAAALIALSVEGAVKLDRYYAAQTKPDWRQLTATLVQAAQPDALVLVSPNGFAKIIRYYLRRLGPRPEPLAVAGLPEGSEEAPLHEALQSARPIWLVVDLDSRPAVAALAEQAAILSEQARTHSIRLYRLEPRN